MHGVSSFKYDVPLIYPPVLTPEKIMSQSLAALVTHVDRRRPRFGEGALTVERAEVVTHPGDPEVLLRNLARSVFEVLAGVREVEQMSRWLTPDMYSRMLAHAQHAARGRNRRGEIPARPVIEPLQSVWQEPSVGIVEATVLVDLGVRVRAVALRLEAYRGRWRAERINVL